LIRKRLVLESYVRDLPQRLAREYGSRDSYSIEQINAVLSSWEMDREFEHYAYAMLATAEEVIAKRPQLGAAYSDLRAEVGGKFFRGRASFTARDVLAFSRHHWNLPPSMGVPVTEVPSGFSPASDQPANTSMTHGAEFGPRAILFTAAAVVLLAVLLGALVPFLLS
jgi:hypothetical protein